MGLKNKLNELNSTRKRTKRFEKYNNVVKKTDKISLNELSQRTNVPLDQVKEDINSYVEQLNIQEPFFKRRYYLDNHDYTVHRKSWLECIKDWRLLKPAFFALPILPIIFFVLGLTLFFNDRSSQKNEAVHTQVSKIKTSSSTDSSSSSKIENDTLEITKRKNDLKVDSGDGTYIGKSTNPEQISFKASEAKLESGTYHIKWGHGVWSGSDPDYAYATIVINDDNNNLIQITEDAPQDVSIKSSDIVNVQMFGKGTGDTLKFSK
ncbi:hypothetical protein FGL85_11005 [Leuconostoc pseudomesenteroides]|uniref:Uncharacterized protein n=1 Tax=Leuconostoc pseudomesenteroides TaxID=33968 RepID=A0A5B8T2Z8_LEUPS|nr:hypothetical protein [Leuconostoc pseudomesenteroides]QEA43001.1 hypothetical protein FGL85_11005 [Leuconostoc pseudomesenteroides]